MIARSRPRVVARAIVGQPLTDRDSTPARIEAAIADVATLAEQLAATRLWPMIEPERATAAWCASRKHLVVRVWLPVPPYSPHTTLYACGMEYRFGWLRGYDDGWYDEGWHRVSPPRHRDADAAALVTPALNRRYRT